MFRKNVDPSLDAAISSIYESMSTLDQASPDYSTLVDQLSKLYALKESNSKRRITPDTLVNVAGTLLGILAIVGHERTNIVTSKALNFVMKMR